MLGLGYPGGPALERAARAGDPARFPFPRPRVGRPGCDFSFSGLKTAVAQTVEALGTRSEQDTADVAASFEAAVTKSICDRTANALETFRAAFPRATTLVVAGGVAANAHLRAALAALAETHGCRLVAPPRALCSDNAAMVAWAGIERLRLGLTDALDFAPRPRWPLAEVRGAA